MAHWHQTTSGIVTCLYGLIVVASASCGNSLLNEYLNADSAIWTSVHVFADSAGSAEITVQENGAGPELTVHYSCADYSISRLYKLDAELLVEGNPVQPDQENINASCAGRSIDFPVKDCCNSIGEKLAIDSTHYMESFPVGLILSKKYSHLKELPGQLSVHFTSEAAGGNTDTTILLTLRTTKDTRASVRFH